MMVMLMRFVAKVIDIGEAEVDPGRVDVAVERIPGGRIVLRRELISGRRQHEAHAIVARRRRNQGVVARCVCHRRAEELRLRAVPKLHRDPRPVLARPRPAGHLPFKSFHTKLPTLIGVGVRVGVGARNTRRPASKMVVLMTFVARVKISVKPRLDTGRVDVAVQRVPGGRIVLRRELISGRWQHDAHAIVARRRRNQGVDARCVCHRRAEELRLRTVPELHRDPCQSWLTRVLPAVAIQVIPHEVAHVDRRRRASRRRYRSLRHRSVGHQRKPAAQEDGDHEP